MTYEIGGHTIIIEGAEQMLDTLLPSFVPFKVISPKAEPVITLILSFGSDGNTPQTQEKESHLIRDIDTGNGMTRVDKFSDGGYQFLIRNIQGEECALLTASATFHNCHCRILCKGAYQQFALNNALMIAYAFSTARRQTLLLHASVIRYEGKAYAFTAPSGTGKSTQVANWLRTIPGCDMINDDNPIITIIDGQPILFGSPWSGKTPCYRNTCAPLGAIVKIARDTTNHVSKMSPLQAFSTILSACSSMKWDEEIYQDICTTTSAVIEKTGIYTLHCLPDPQSAIVCRDNITSHPSPLTC